MKECLLLLLLLNDFIFNRLIGRLQVSDTADQFKILIDSVLDDCRNDRMIIAVHRLNGCEYIAVFLNLKAQRLLKVVNTEKIRVQYVHSLPKIIV